MKHAADRFRGEIMRFVGVVMAASLLATMGGGVAAAPSHSSGPFQVGIDLGAREQDLEAGPFLTQMDLLQQRDLWVRVKVPKMAKTATVSLSLINPGGVPFYETSLLFSRDPKIKSGHLAGVDQPAAALPARRLTGGYALDQPIPIAGSVFVRYPTPGTWTVRAQVTGIDAPLTRTVEFVVTPMGEAAP